MLYGPVEDDRSRDRRRTKAGDGEVNEAPGELGPKTMNDLAELVQKPEMEPEWGSGYEKSSCSGATKAEDARRKSKQETRLSLVRGYSVPRARRSQFIERDVVGACRT